MAAEMDRCWDNRPCKVLQSLELPFACERVDNIPLLIKGNALCGFQGKVAKILRRFLYSIKSFLIIVSVESEQGILLE